MGKCIAINFVQTDKRDNGSSSSSSNRGNSSSNNNSKYNNYNKLPSVASWLV